MSPPTTTDPDPPVTYTQFACIGTGFSGICLGATLSRWHNLTSLALFSRDPDLGGTWVINQYPGAACDVPSALYSYSFAPNPNWTRVLPPGRELYTYLRGVAEKYGLVDKMRFGVEVQRAEWIEERGRWRVSGRVMATGERWVHECQVLVSAAGHFMKVRELDVPGLEVFRGEVFHSARWRGDVELKGKRVVVFGNGCTAAQIVPSIVGETRHLTQVVRSKHWVYPAIDRKIPGWARVVLGSVPGLTWFNRAMVYLMAEVDFKGFKQGKSAAKFRQMRRRQVEKYMRDTAPEKYHDLLIPDFEVGCKRRIFDSGYLESLHAENLTLTDEKPVEILPNGVRMASGEVTEADVIILANGFTTNEYLGGVEVVGRGGETVAQHWESFGGPEAYNCTALSGFPNFFLVMGPNTATGHTSTIMCIENGINYSLRVLKPVLEGRASVACVKRSAEERYVNRIQAALQNTVWATGCNSWYTRGPGGKIWNGMTYPWTQAYNWYASLFPEWRDWEYSGKTSKPSFKRRSPGLWVLSLLTLVGGLLAWTKSHPQSQLASLISSQVAALPELKTWAVSLLRKI